MAQKLIQDPKEFVSQSSLSSEAFLIALIKRLYSDDNYELSQSSLSSEAFLIYSREELVSTVIRQVSILS